MFDVKDALPQWEKVYNLLAAAEVDQIITYEEFDKALKLDFRAAQRPGFDKAVQQLERRNLRTVDNVRNKGYRIVRAHEHERLARKHQLKGLRQTKRSMRKVKSADRSKLGLDEKRRLDALEMHYVQLQAAQRRNAERIEQVDTARKLDRRQVTEEVALLAQQVQRLQQQVDSRKRELGA